MGEQLRAAAARRCKGNQYPTQAGNLVEILSIPSNGKEGTFLTHAVTWEDHLDSNVHTKVEEW